MLCVQTDPKSRPRMSSVVQRLEGKVGAIPRAPIDDYGQMGLLLPSEKMRRDGLYADEESWNSGSTSTMMSKSRKLIFSDKTSSKYMRISSSDEYMDSLELSDHIYKNK